MRVQVVYLMCAAGLLVSARAAPVDSDGTDPEAMAMAAEGAAFDTPESFAYLLPRISARYRPSEQWNSLAEQDLFLDTSGLSDQVQEPEERFKRAGNGPSLSIINPLDVLRQRLLLEMARRQMRESQKQVAENRKLMKTIGKRGRFLRQPHDLRRPNPLGYDIM